MTTTYGSIRPEECDLLDRLTSKLKTEFGIIAFLEIGTFAGETMRGIYRRAESLQCPILAAGVDLSAPSPVPPGYRHYTGDSMDMWRKITDSFNLLFVDGCHCVNHAMCDFLNYSPLVCVGGYALFHDTSPGTRPDAGLTQDNHPQNHSYAGQPSSFLGVRDGLKRIGLLQNYRVDWELVEEIQHKDGLMGMCLFRKRREL